MTNFIYPLSYDWAWLQNRTPEIDKRLLASNKTEPRWDDTAGRRLVNSVNDVLVNKNIENIEKSEGVKYLKRYGVTYGTCLEAVKKDGLAIRYIMTNAKLSSIHLQKVQLNAIKTNKEAFLSVKNPTFQFITEAVKMNGLVIQYVRNKTATLCMLAVQQNGFAIALVPNKTPKLCIEALKQNMAAESCIEFAILNKIDEVEFIRDMTICLHQFDLPTDILLDISKAALTTTAMSDTVRANFIDQIKRSCYKIEK